MRSVLQRREDTLTIRVPEEVDHCFADLVREPVDRLLQTEPINCLEFDFRDTRFMDSSGIGLLMGRYKLMKALKGTVRITNAGARIQRILMLSGIHKIISIEEEASSNDTEYEAGV